jgi:hypothetical protein
LSECNLEVINSPWFLVYIQLVTEILMSTWNWEMRIKFYLRTCYWRSFVLNFYCVFLYHLCRNCLFQKTRWLEMGYIGY